MAWGGGGAFAPPMGGAPIGRTAPGLPFGGIPPELQSGVDALLKEEPDHGEPSASFSQQADVGERRRLTLWRLLRQYPHLLVSAAVIVTVTSVIMQAGPKLTEIAINDGMSPGHENFAVVALVAGLYLVSIAASALLQRAGVKVTGRLAAYVMNDLRVRVFSHLQRLSLDFFTREKAGVLMSRMTSDIENLQQLLQDGLAQFAVQGLTMIVITAILFTLDVRLAFITVVLIVPALAAMSLWFRRSFRAGLRPGPGRDRQRPRRPLRELARGPRRDGPQPPAAQRRPPPQCRRRATATPTTTPPRSTPSTGRAPSCSACSAKPSCSGSAATWSCTGSLSLGALVAFFLYLNRFLQPIQLLVQQYNTYQQGQASVLKLRTLLETEPDGAGVADGHGAAAGRAVRSSSTTVSFGYEPSVPVLTA